MRVSAGARVGSTSTKSAVWISVIFDGVLVSALNWKIGRLPPLRFVTWFATSLSLPHPPDAGATGQFAVIAAVSVGSAPPATPVWVSSHSAPFEVL